jgi:hypothetical protein
MFVVGATVGTGIPGLLAFVGERITSFGDDRRPTGLTTFTLTTPIAYTCWARTKAGGRFEYGVCLPYLSYGRGHPLYGDRMSLFIPLVGGVTLAACGALGLTCQLPVFGPFLRIGFSVFIGLPGAKDRIARIFGLADRLIAGVRASAPARAIARALAVYRAARAASRP